MKSGLYTTTSDDQLDQEETTKHFLKAKLAPKKRKKKFMVTVWWSAAPLIHYSFLSPRETITSEKYAQQIDEMRQKLQGLTAHCATNTSKVEQILLQSFASSAIFT